MSLVPNVMSGVVKVNFDLTPGTVKTGKPDFTAHRSVVESKAANTKLSYAPTRRRLQAKLLKNRMYSCVIELTTSHLLTVARLSNSSRAGMV